MGARHRSSQQWSRSMQTTKANWLHMHLLQRRKVEEEEPEVDFLQSWAWCGHFAAGSSAAGEHCPSLGAPLAPSAAISSKTGLFAAASVLPCFLNRGQDASAVSRKGRNLRSEGFRFRELPLRVAPPKNLCGWFRVWGLGFRV